MTQGRAGKILDKIRILLLYLSTLIFLLPFYIALVYAFKSPEQTANSPLGFPTELYLGNFKEAFKIPNYFNNIKNSTVVAVAVIAIIVVVCSMAAYIITRKNNKKYNLIFYVFQLAVLLPFQVIMFPLYLELKQIGALNTLFGLILAQTGLFMGFYVFLYSGFIKTVPIALEEAAMIDGCSKYRTFFQIVFPLLKPIHMTIIVLAALASWNDFIIAMIVVQKNVVRTLPLVQFYFFGEYSQDVNMAFAAVLIAMIPIILIYFFLQKYITEGVTAGAVKS